jgi:hypothetical protein
MRINSGSIFGEAAKIIISLLLCAGVARSQEWTRVEVSGAQGGRQYTEFTLQGKFLKAPSETTEVFPLIVLRCQPGRYSSGHLRGKFLAAVLHVGTVLDGAIVRNEIREELFSAIPDPDSYYVEFSVDEGEPKSEHWDSILDYQGVGFGLQELNNILWGQISPHKEGANPPVKKFVITVQQNRTGKIIMQFDLPDPTVVSELCGCTYFKEKN